MYSIHHKATHNPVYGYEVNGNLDEVKQWASNAAYRLQQPLVVMDRRMWNMGLDGIVAEVARDGTITA